MAKARGRATLLLTQASTGLEFNLAQALDALELYVETKDLDVGDPDLCAMIDGIRTELRDALGVKNLTLTLKWKNTLDGTYTSSTPISLASGDDTQFFREPSAKYFRIRYDDPSPNKRWQIHAIEIFGHQDGGRL